MHWKKQKLPLTQAMKISCTPFSNHPRITETPCPTLLPAPLKSSLHFTAILLTKPEESPLLPRFLPVTILISKISESYTTGNLKRECFALSSIRKLHVQKQPLCFRNTDI